MATIAVPTFLDGGTARTAGEAWTLNTGSSLTIRTDTRVHANAPASNTGSLGSITINEGDHVWDSTAIRWMPFNSGTGNVPIIGTSITQGAVSGYLLGVWASITSLPTAVGVAMPTSGFIKFREVTGGSFIAGALSGIGASATGPDDQGWMEIVFDSSANITVPRLGKHTTRGGKFFLANTTGVRGQTFQIPTMGSAGMVAPGLFIETDVATDEYEFWPSLSVGAGWTHIHAGNATGTTDARQKFLKATGGGVMTMGETWSSAATYASIAAQASTYASISQSCSYTWENNVVEIYCAAGHLLETGQQTGLDFTSGGATANDGIYTITVLDPYHFTVNLIGSGASGTVTSRPGVTVTFTAHGLNIGESTYCDFTSGTGVDGTYEIYAVTSANAYLIKYPHTVALTSGAVSCIHTLQITLTAHGLAQGQTVYCDFTSGGAADGVYVAKVVAANTININYPHTAVIATSNVTLSRDIGYVCGSGRRTWIPSNILTEVATGARATNIAPNSTPGTRPEWATTAAGALDLEYVYGTSGYLNAAQAYSTRIRSSVFFETAVISEVASALDIDGLYFGAYNNVDFVVLTLSYCYAGGSVKNINAPRANTPGTTDHAVSLLYCKGVNFDNISGNIVQYARSSGYPINVATCSDCTFNNPKVANGPFNISGSPNITINDIDFCERNNGNGLGAATLVSADANCNNLKVDGVTYGLGFTVPNQQPNRLLYTIGCQNVKLRNCGSLESPMPSPTWAKNLTILAYLYQSGGANNGVKVQKVFAEGVRTAPFATVNSDKNMLYESARYGLCVWSAKAYLNIIHADLNGTIKNVGALNSTTGQSSVYGTHFLDTFLGSDFGRIVLICNEPTIETASIFTSVVGTPKWNSSGGVFIPNVGDQHIWETPHFIKGHTGFLRGELTGALTSWYTQYQIDKGAGYSEWRNAYYQRSGASGTSGQYTFTVTDSTGIQVGDYCWGTGLSTVNSYLKSAKIPRVTQINGNTITTDRANTGTVSGVIRFNHLPDESEIDPSIGIRLKIRMTCITSNVSAITFIRIDTLTSQAAQDNYYDLDTVTLTVSGLEAGSDIVIRQAGTETVMSNFEDYSGTSLNYVYSEVGTAIDIDIYKPGYMPYTVIRNYVLPATNASIPVKQTQDPSYLD